MASSDSEGSIPPEFLRNVQSMSDFAETIKLINDAADGNYAVTLAPAQCASLIWAMKLLKAGGDG